MGDSDQIKRGCVTTRAAGIAAGGLAAAGREMLGLALAAYVVRLSPPDDGAEPPEMTGGGPTVVLVAGVPSLSESEVGALRFNAGIDVRRPPCFGAAPVPFFDGGVTAVVS